MLMLMSRVRIQTRHYIYILTPHLPAGPGHMQQMVTVGVLSLSPGSCEIVLGEGFPDDRRLVVMFLRGGELFHVIHQKRVVRG